MTDHGWVLHGWVAARMTLTEFLLARLDEDEAEINEVAAAWSRPMMNPTEQIARDCISTMARMLVNRSVATRRIVKMIDLELVDDDFDQTALAMLRVLAQPYLGHPDFDPAWKVDS